MKQFDCHLSSDSRYFQTLMHGPPKISFSVNLKVIVICLILVQYKYKLTIIKLENGFQQFRMVLKYELLCFIFFNM